MSQLVTTIYKHLNEAKLHLNVWREQAYEDYAFFAGDQYSSRDRALLLEQQRPIITFNRIGPVIDIIRGTEILNRTELRFSPREEGDVKINEVLTNAAKWVRDLCDAEDEESDAFLDVLICGMGWVETRLDFKDDPNGKILIERVDPFEMYWDPKAKKSNLVDAKWVMRVKRISHDQLLSLWPEMAHTLNKQKTYEIIEYQWYENGGYFQAFLCEKQLIQQGASPANKIGFTYKAITHKHDRNNNHWFGMVRAMKDPQRWANKWLSQVLHIINSNAKGGLIAEKNAFINPSSAEEDWADPTSIIFLKEGGIHKVQPKPTPPFPHGLEHLMQFSIGAIRDVTGISEELLGQVGRAQPGILEQQRKQSGFSLLAPLFNALRRYRKEQGRLLLHFITHYISDGRLMRINGEGVAKYIKLELDHLNVEYDVIVDEAPNTPNQKEQIFHILQYLIPQMQQAGVMIPQEVFDYMPLPQSLVEAWKKSLGATTKGTL